MSGLADGFEAAIRGALRIALVVGVILGAGSVLLYEHCPIHVRVERAK